MKKIKPKKQKLIQKKTKRNIFNWKNVQIGRKYVTVFFITALLFIIAGLSVYLQLQKGQQDIEAIEQHSSRVNDMAQMASIIQVKDVQIADYLLTDSKRYAEAFAGYQEDFDRLVVELTPLMKTDEQIAIFNEIQEYDKKINDIFDEISYAISQKQHYMASSIRNRSSELRNTTVHLVNNLMGLVKEEQEVAVKEAKNSMDISAIILAISNVSAVLIGTLLLIIVSRKITSSLKKIVGITTAVSNGNLRVKSMDYEGKDEIGQLVAAINQMKKNIQNIIHKIDEASTLVSSKSEALSQSAIEVKEGNVQIAYTMEELSTGAETQANSASDLSERMNNFVEKVNLSEKSGQRIATESNRVLTLTNDGSNLMEKSVKQMKQIDTIVSETVAKVQGLDHQSNEISKLILVIKDISSQTNLLALNAAIEAARAGEHGKGFAVVANEVKKLSEQVAKSVGEITVIVTSIQKETNHVVETLNAGYQEVQEGTNQIEATGRNFEMINQSVTEMANKISDISSNLNEIALNSNDMNHLIEEIASVSEESAAGVEQTAASAQQTSSSMEEVSNSADELSKLAEQLNTELKVFKL